jgi:hypothetical protein
VPVAGAIDSVAPRSCTWPPLAADTPLPLPVTLMRLPSISALLPAPVTVSAKLPALWVRTSSAPSCRLSPSLTCSGPVRSAAWTGSAAHRAVASRLGRRGQARARAPGARRRRVGEAYMLMDFLWQGAARLRGLARQGRVAAEAHAMAAAGAIGLPSPMAMQQLPAGTMAGCVQPRNRHCPMESGVS